MLIREHKYLVQALKEIGPTNPAVIYRHGRVADSFEHIEDVRAGLRELASCGLIEPLVFEHRGERWTYAYAAR